MTTMTPTRMRALADAPDVNHWSANARDALRAAADSVEQWIRVAARLSDRLDDAPHDSYCIADLPSGRHECICWKGEAL